MVFVTTRLENVIVLCHGVELLVQSLLYRVQIHAVGMACVPMNLGIVHATLRGAE